MGCYEPRPVWTSTSRTTTNVRLYRKTFFDLVNYLFFFPNAVVPLLVRSQ